MTHGLETIRSFYAKMGAELLILKRGEAYLKESVAGLIGHNFVFLWNHIEPNNLVWLTISFDKWMSNAFTIERLDVTF